MNLLKCKWLWSVQQRVKETYICKIERWKQPRPLISHFLMEKNTFSRYSLWKEEEKLHHWQDWEVELCVEAQRLKAPEGNSYSCLTTLSELLLQVQWAPEAYRRILPEICWAALWMAGTSLVWQVIFTFSHPISGQLQENNTVTHCRPLGQERFSHFSNRLDFSWLWWAWFHGHFSTRTDLSVQVRQIFLLGGFF